MNERTTPARDHQAPDSPREAKPACTARNHSLWQNIHNLKIPERFNLSGPQTSILLYLGNRCGMNDEWSFAVSQAQIARETRNSISTVQRTINHLDSLHLGSLPLLNIDAGRGRGHKHRYTFPADLDTIPKPKKVSERHPLEDIRPANEKVSERHPLPRKGVRETPEKVSERHPVVKEVDPEGRKEGSIHPSTPQLSAAEIDFNRRMFEHPEIALPKSKTDEIATTYPAQEVFAVCCQYRADFEAGQKISSLVLPTRFQNADDFPRQTPAECPGSNFYYDFCHSVGDFDEESEASAFDEHLEDLDDPPVPRPTDDGTAVAEAGEAALSLATEHFDNPDTEPLSAADPPDQTLASPQTDAQPAQDAPQSQEIPERASKARLRQVIKKLGAVIADLPNDRHDDHTARTDLLSVHKDILDKVPRHVAGIKKNQDITPAEAEQQIKALELSLIQVITSAKTPADAATEAAKLLATAAAVGGNNGAAPPAVNPDTPTLSATKPADRTLDSQQAADLPAQDAPRSTDNDTAVADAGEALRSLAAAAVRGNNGAAMIQPDERITIWANGVLDSKPWPTPEKARKKIAETIRTINAKQLSPANTQERLNQAIFEIVNPIDKGEEMHV